jgi:hypothetical protein
MAMQTLHTHPMSLGNASTLHTHGKFYIQTRAPDSSRAKKPSAQKCYFVCDGMRARWMRRRSVGQARRNDCRTALAYGNHNFPGQ